MSNENLDFNTIRDVMYKYSKKAQQTFLEQKLLSFLFCWFAGNPDSLTFIRQKYDSKGKEYLNKILDEIEELRGQSQAAMKTLKFEAGLKFA